MPTYTNNQPSITLDKNSRILFLVMALLITASIGATFWRIMIKKDYLISAQADCDPTTEKCFVYVCDPATEECTGDVEEDTWYYKKIERKAYNIPLCDPADETCEAFVCQTDEKDCAITFCDSETTEEGEICSYPEEYNIMHPEEELDEEAEETEETEEGEEGVEETEVD